MWSSPASPFAPGPSAAWLSALVTSLFLLSGAVWVLGTDVLLYSLVDDPSLIARVETAKGWTFVALAGLLLFAVTFVATARLARQRRLLVTIFESIGDGVLLLGPDRRILHANPAALQQLRARPQDLVGMDAAEFSRRYRVSYPDGALVPPDRFVSQRVFDEGGPLRYKAVLHPPGGDELVISSTGAAVRERADEPPSMVVSVMHDITEREHLDQLHDGFFAAVAHALKTPVAVIDLHTRRFARADVPRLRRSAEAIERECARLDALVQNLLVLGRAHSGTLRLHPRAVRLSSVLTRVARDRAVTTLRRQVQTELHDDASVWADDERLVTAVRNVVVDAARASPDSAVTLLLRRAGDHVELGVRSSVSPEPTELALDHDDRAVGLEVAEIVVAAHGGSQRQECEGPEQTRWIRLPTLPEEHASA